MRAVLPAACALAGLALSACSSDSIGTATDESPVPVQLCVSDSCGSKTILLDLPSAENSLFTPDGRLFVSGGDSVYEITRDAEGAWQSAPIYDGSCNFTGLAQIGDVLYANCFDGQLYAGRITAHPQLAAIYDMGLGAPNGLASGPDGELYVVNGPVSSSSAPDPKIVRIRLDAADPMQVIEQSDWLATGALTFPNGIQRRGRTLYYTMSDTLAVALGSVQSVEIQPDGSAGEPQAVGFFDSIPDDFGLAGDGFLLAYYATGQIALMDADGSIAQSTAPLSFDNPSSVKLGVPPLFAPGELLVTEKGVVGLPPTPGYGNVLTVFRPKP